MRKKYIKLFVWLVLLFIFVHSKIYADCIVNNTTYASISSSSGAYISLNDLKSRASSWNNSTDLVTTCDVTQITSMSGAFKNNTAFNFKYFI